VIAAGNKSPLKLFTWNAFGGMELVHENFYVNRKYHEEWINDEDIFNYFVKGDIVSKIGVHIGPSYQLVGNDVGSLNPKSAHVIETMIKIVGDNPLISFSNPPRVDLQPNGPLKFLKENRLQLGGFFIPVIKYRVETITGKYTKFIAQIAEQAAEIGPTSKGMSNLMKYINYLCFSEADRVGRHTSNAKEMISRVKKATIAFAQKLPR
jgi:hypothetical protein